MDHRTLSDCSTSSSDDDDIDVGRKAEAIDRQTNRDGTATTASVDEIKLLKELSKGNRLAAGRFSGREGKMARLRAQEASLSGQAISALGLETKSQGTASAPSSSIARASDRSDMTSDAHPDIEEASTERKGKKAKKLRTGIEIGDPPASIDKKEESKKRRIMIEPAIDRLTETVFQFQATPREGWWGASVFVSAGCLDGLRKPQDQTNHHKRTAFNEDEQARIYNDAQAGKANGKIGLGQATRTMKVGGVQWAGKKVSFEVEEGDQGGKGDSRVEKRLKVVESSSKLTIDSDEGPNMRVPPTSDIKWKGIVKKALKKAKSANELKLKALFREVTVVLQGKGRSMPRADVESCVMTAIKNSSQFTLVGKRVRLKP